ncbi:hypothetical protein GCM10009530_63960 [Microbispora corallina]|uniref:Uncharacterized protein n=1 Tax=Microbispora corallina TaxID=83302 RepID=A0ABQ4GCI5_9ACTN|nr:hypothetical protein [Microbispora corallina]GIH44721.1 hypothetical protein Mco01_77210 [Microbispora corallina]
MEPISSLSRINVYSFITGASGSEDVEVAFTTPGVEPAEEDWHIASWGTPTSQGCPARILVGPGGGAVALSDGTYEMWVRVTGPVQQPVLRAGLVPVT